MSDPSPSPLEHLVRLAGIASGYTHADGRWVDTAPATLVRLLAALGIPADTPDAVAESLVRLRQAAWTPGLPPVWVMRQGTDPALPLVEEDTGVRRPAAVLETEDGRRRSFPLDLDAAPVEAQTTCDGRRLVRRRVSLPVHDLPWGYHRLTVGAHSLPLIVPPPTGHMPPALAHGARLWGVAVQVPGLRSHRNWGHGNLGDLGRLAENAADLGADAVGVNPLHTLFPSRPTKRCPYAPSSRFFLNPLILDITAVPELADAPALRARLEGTAFQAEIERLRADALIDYGAVAAHVYAALEDLYVAFRERHLAEGTERAAQFQAHVQAGGRRLEKLACYEALAERFGPVLPDSAGTQWTRWPAAYHDPDGPAVAAFAAVNADRLRFRQYLQFETDRQLAEAGATAARRMAIGLYRDLAVGFDRDGADAWMDQALVPPAVSVGCPPDLRNPLGQDWGVAPWHPERLRAAAYAPFIELLRANLRYAGALRLDHAFQLQRLYWIPFGGGARRGGYVSYPLADLMAIVALESRRAHCLVIAEDLGTIPEGFRETAMASGTFSYRILHRERGPDRSYLPPDQYPRAATAALGTHDQATFAGFWAGRDVAVRRALNLYPSPEDGAAAEQSRAQDRGRLLQALGFAPEDAAGLTDPDGRPGAALILAVHRFLAATGCALVTVQPDDLLGALDQINLPATVDEYPNWRRKSPLDIEDLATHPLVAAAARILSAR